MSWVVAGNTGILCLGALRTLPREKDFRYFDLPGETGPTEVWPETKKASRNRKAFHGMRHKSVADPIPQMGNTTQQGKDRKAFPFIRIACSFWADQTGQNPLNLHK